MGVIYLSFKNMVEDDAKNFTRSWFAWANTLFGELVLHVADTHPEVLQRDFR